MTFRPARHSAKYPSRGSAFSCVRQAVICGTERWRRLARTRMLKRRRKPSRHCERSEAIQRARSAPNNKSSVRRRLRLDCFVARGSALRAEPRTPRNDGAGQLPSRLLNSIVKQPDASRSSDCASLHPGYRQTRVIAPVSSPARGSPVVFVPFSPEGACGTTGRFTAPAAPCASTWPPCAKAHGKNKQPRTQIVACVPHANGFFGLLHH